MTDQFARDKHDGNITRRRLGLVLVKRGAVRATDDDDGSAGHEGGDDGAVGGRVAAEEEPILRASAELVSTQFLLHFPLYSNFLVFADMSRACPSSLSTSRMPTPPTCRTMAQTSSTITEWTSLKDGVIRA